MAKELKQLIVDELARRYAGLDRCVVVNFTGVSAGTANEIRRRLRETDITLQVVKKSLIARALSEVGLDELVGLIVSRDPSGRTMGTTALATGADDVIALARSVTTEADRNENLVVRGGFADKRLLSSDDVKRYARIPGRPVLLSHLLSVASTPLVNFVSLLDGFTCNFVSTLDAVARKRTDASSATGDEEAA